jgi:hypothetical protein
MAAITVKDVADRLAKQFGPDWKPDGSLSVGSPTATVTGIATSWSPTMDVLSRAVAKKQNLVLSMEPAFWTGKPAEGRSMNPDQMKDDPTFKLKRAYIDKNQLNVLHIRYGWVARSEDGQLKGLAHALAWEKNYKPRAGVAPWAKGNNAFSVPATTFGNLVKGMKQQLKAKAIRCIGDPNLRVSNVALAHGYFLVPDLERVLADNPNADVVVCGEPCEWEAGPYFMDLIASGQKKAMIILGSQVSSEPGMSELAAWVRTFVNEVPVEWQPAGEPFQPVLVS